ncbi:unnamed protein product [Macrosiphum euphorbiae]|uniref:Reverse transcriptase domain-containing protein n=1 Tax=Macrosiphum euphorbiae TaxID=13131 RepID=A0AAV0Y2H7_9HEMI|nr:unnamed protein product [Macrosiphum euphorbiae]
MADTRILFWNCQGVARKRLELLDLVQRKKVDIILLNETHLASNSQFNLPNFFSYATNRPLVNGHPPAGGTAVLVNKKFIHHHVKIITTSINNTAIVIQINDAELTLVSAYKSPGTQLVTSDLDIILDSGQNVIIAGDLNAKHLAWNSRSTNTAGRTLFNYLDSRLDTTVTAPTSPTRYPTNPNHNPDVLDIAIIKAGSLSYHLENLTNELSSDHSPILLDIHHRSAHISPPKPRYITDWIKYELDMLSKPFSLPEILTEEQVDSAIQHLSNFISDNVKINSTIHNPSDRKTDLPLSIQFQITKKRRLRSIWQRTRNPDIKTLLNRQNRLVSDLLQSNRDEEWSNFLSSIDIGPQGWSRLYKLNRRLLRKSTASHPLKDDHGFLHYDSLEKANIFASSMENQFSPLASTSWVDEIVQDTLEQHLTSIYDKNIFFSPGEIWNNLRKLPNKSAPGPDLISNCALKRGGKKLAIYLCKIFNSCTRLEYFPNQWKIADIIMIPKPKKDPKIPTNHRPISLLNTMGKLYEKLLLSRLKSHILPQIRPEQFGFRPQHSTEIQLVNFIDNITNNMNRRLKTAVTLLDIEKAFDKVWHEGLLFKLLAMQVPQQLVSIIQSFLKERKFCIKIDDTRSSPKTIRAGVPQGSCLSPHLFSVYINDMPLSSKAKIALFADDTLFYADSISQSCAIKNLQAQIDLSIEWFHQWKISINPLKTSAIMFSNKQTRAGDCVKFGDTPIKWSNNIKYLGVTIDKKLSFSTHVKNIITKAKGAKHSLFPLINKRSPLSTISKLHIFKTYIRPILTYAGPAWTANISNSSWSKLEAVQSTTLRQITGLDWYVSNDTIRSSLKTPPLKDHLSKNKVHLFKRIKNSSFKHISDILSKNSPKEHFIKKPLS